MALFRGNRGTNYSLTNLDDDDRRRLTCELNETLINGSDDRIIEAAKEFLKLFTPGTFDLWIDTHNTTRYTIYPYPTDLFEDCRMHWIYEGAEFFLTQAGKHIQKQRVDEYVQLITAGVRPKVVAYRNTYTTNAQPTPHTTGWFVLDGHHKLQAYSICNITPYYVFIEKQEPQSALRENLMEDLSAVLNQKELKDLAYCNPRIMLGTSAHAVNFNKLLDDNLKNSEHFFSNIVTLLVSAYRASDNQVNEWAVQRLRALEDNVKRGKSFWLHNGPDNSRKIVSLEDLETWKRTVRDN